MSDGNDDWTQYTEEEWNAFWRSLSQFETPGTLHQAVFNHADDLWAELSPRLMTDESAYIAVQDGQFRATMAGHVLVTAIANAVFRATLNTMLNEEMVDAFAEKLREQYDDAELQPTQQLRPENSCANCGETFDPGMTQCPNCGKEL